MTDVVGNPEEERRAEFYFQPWAQEAVCRYFYSKVMFYTCLATEIFEISKVAWEITLIIDVSLRFSKGGRSWSRLLAFETHKQARGRYDTGPEGVLASKCAADADHYSYITVYLVLSCCSCPEMTLIQKQTYFCCDSAN